MKLILLILISSMCAASGSGNYRTFFPVIVQVVDKQSNTPIRGAKVRIADIPAHQDDELDPKRRTKVLPETLGKQFITNEVGVAVVFYHGRLGLSSNKQGVVHPLLGTVIVDYNGKEKFRQKLKVFAEQNKTEFNMIQAPWILIAVDRVTPDTIPQDDQKPVKRNQ